MNFKKGFTLIELLVVVSIIGILAVVVLASLGSAKNKGEDSAIKTNLATIRNQAEIFASYNKSSYLPTGGATFPIGPCPVYNVSGSNMFEVDSIIADAASEATSLGGSSYCYNSLNNWVMAVGLKSVPNTSWCIDNANSNAKQVSFNTVNAIDPVTLTCK